MRVSTIPFAKPLASACAPLAVSAVAVMATMLLCATGAAEMWLSRPRGVRGLLRSLFTRSATAPDLTSRDTVSTSRVGSLDSRTRGRPTSASVSVVTGVTRRSASASYTWSAVLT